MRFRRTASLLGAAATVAGMGVGAGVAAGTAAAAPAATAGTTGLVAHATPQATASLVATTRFEPTVGGTAGSASLPGSVSASAMPRTPDVGDAASSGTVHVASLSRSQGHSPANSAYPTVPGSPVAGATSGLTSVAGNNGYAEGATHSNNGSLPGVDVEPPDQGLCAGNGYTLELNNEIAQVFKGSTLTSQGVAPLESLFATPEIFGAGGDGSFSVQGDPRCFYDPASGHWFASQLWLDLNDATQYGWAGTFLAVSKTGDPTGSWNVYFVPDVNNITGTGTCNNGNPATSSTANPCFGDQPLLGVDQYSVQISTNEYSIYGATPNGTADLYFLSKSALASGAKSVPVLWSSPGSTVAAPGAGPWYSIAPAQAPNGDYSTANGGSSFGLSSLDFTGSGDNRIAEWAYTDTSAVNSKSGAVNIYEQTLGSGAYAMPPAFAAQKTGPTPLGDYWNQLNGAKSHSPLPEGGLATNDDRMTTATYDPFSGALVGGLNTGVNQVTGGSSTRTLAGVAYFVVTPALGSSGLSPSSVSTGYVSPSGADALFPAAAIGSTGRGVIAYTLSGTGYYPSTGYAVVAAGDAVDPTTHVARAGAGPQDGFTEYQSSGTAYYRPRWGDYSEAVANGSQITFANEMINQSCTDSQFVADFTCGGTRDLFINWGTSVDTVTP